MIQWIIQWIEKKREENLKKILKKEIIDRRLIETLNEVEGMLLLKWKIFEIAKKQKTSPLYIAAILQKMIDEEIKKGGRNGNKKNT